MNDTELRERLGRVVRDAWVTWASEQPNPKPHHLDPWEALPEPIKEVDRRIGMAVIAAFAGLTDDLDRFAHEITSAALRDDGDALRENVQSLIVTCRQLRNELERERQNQQTIVQAAEQGIAALNDALVIAGTRMQKAEADREALCRVLDVLTRVGDGQSARSIASTMLQRMRKP